ncbi:hypothetical protein [Myceligenerans crystallogenes]|uniref:hypothetical protein n=1 Tax=Myceligenerans crystallogenes TaxID=316335 RepID=UPI0031DD254B
METSAVTDQQEPKARRHRDRLVRLCALLVTGFVLACSRGWSTVKTCPFATDGRIRTVADQASSSSTSLTAALVQVVEERAHTFSRNPASPCKGT